MIWTGTSDFPEASFVTINNAYVFYSISGVFFAYILYQMIRKRKGERPGSRESDTEL